MSRSPLCCTFILLMVGSLVVPSLRAQCSDCFGLGGEFDVPLVRVETSASAADRRARAQAGDVTAVAIPEGTDAFEEADSLRTRAWRGQPGSTINTPTAFGPKWGEVYAGVSYQHRIRYSRWRDGIVGMGVGFGNPHRTVGLAAAAAAAEGSRTEALARSARYLARDIGASTVVAVSESGFTARKTAMFRPGVPVVATTPNDRVRRQLALSWGVRPVLTEYAQDMEMILDNAVEAALDTGGASSGDTLVVLSGMLTEFEGTNTTNTLKVHVAAETLVTGKATVAGHVAAPVYRVDDGDLSAVPEGSIVALGPDFAGEFSGDLDAIAGIDDAREGMTGYPAVDARELGVPMVSGASLPESVADGTVVTLDGERGIVYDGDVIAAARER